MKTRFTSKYSLRPVFGLEIFVSRSSWKTRFLDCISLSLCDQHQKQQLSTRYLQYSNEMKSIYCMWYTSDQTCGALQSQLKVLCT